MLDLQFYYGTEKYIEKIKKSNPQISNLIFEKIANLRLEPLPDGFKKLKRYNSLYRIRVRDYRIVYEFDNENLTIIMVDIRSRVYEALERKVGHLKK